MIHQSDWTKAAAKTVQDDAASCGGHIGLGYTALLQLQSCTGATYTSFCVLFV